MAPFPRPLSSPLSASARACRRLTSARAMKSSMAILASRIASASRRTPDSTSGGPAALPLAT
eukprot:1187740-Alexandrium_andersonii.AAC.1